MPTSVIITLITFVTLLVTFYLYAQYWKKKAAFAFMLYGRSAHQREDRKWAAHHAFMAGHQDAYQLYALACPEKFDKERPLIPFYRKKIKCIFIDYYYSQKYHDWIAEDQWQFAQTVYQFKEGKDDCSPYITQAFQKLGVTSEVTIMFMPCSTPQRYYTRFSSLSQSLAQLQGIRSGFDYVIYTGERHSKHTTLQRDKIDESSNYILSESVKGKQIVILDDLLTTGSSLYSYAQKLKASGAEVIGAVFLAKTFLLPSATTVKWTIWKQYFLS